MSSLCACLLVRNSLVNRVEFFPKKYARSVIVQSTSLTTVNFFSTVPFLSRFGVKCFEHCW